MYSIKRLAIIFTNGGIALLVILLLLSSCQEDIRTPPPENLLDEQTYIDLLIEFQLIDAYYNRFRSAQDTLPDMATMRNDVLDRYDTNWSQFKRSHDYYKTQPGEQLNRIDKTIEELRKRDQQPGKGPQRQDRN